MDLLNFSIQLLNSVQYGLLLFMLAAGLTLIFGIMGVVNLAHGSFYMLGAFLAWSLSSLLGSFTLAILVGTALSVVFGLLLEKLLFKHFYHRDHLDQVLLTFGLIYVFEELRSMLWGDDVHGVPIPEALSASIALTDTLSYPVYRLFMSGVCLVLALGLYLLISKTRLGMKIRAGAFNREMTESLGVNIKLIHSVVFALGIGLACTQWDFARNTLAGLRELAGPGGDVPVIGHGQNLPMRDAVIMNALLVHGLDYDDTHPRGVIHATASVLPACLALAHRLDASGAQLLVAYILGVETATRLGAAAKGGFHQVGFHPTGLIGTFGCTLSAAHLLGLPAEAMHSAQGIALSVASGSLEFLQDGAWTKRMHPGWAGAAGITAATLAKNGFVGTRRPYEGRFGLYASHLGALAEACDLSLVTAALGHTWEVMNVAIKPVPACHFTHACADAAALLSQQWDGSPVRRIVARVPAGVMKTVCEPLENKRRPANAYEAQFSIPYSVATGLRHGRFGLDALEPEAYEEPQTLALSALVECEADPDAEKAWGEHLNERAKETLYLTTNSYYNGAEVKGKPRVFMPYSGGVRGYRRHLRECAEKGYAGFALRQLPKAVAPAGAAGTAKA